MRKIKVHIGKLIRYCSGVQRHAWYETNVGVIRKPIQAGMIIPTGKIRKVSWWKRLVLFVKRIWIKITGKDIRENTIRRTKRR